ncbi:polysaccharide biosynthesis C-terminal domain-containing protein [Aliiroseovarius sp. KMU-50]|uniref:Polysaccharide biosynthesis C-terminal domain-containing protein n=1 Tax=Aliiroseovarius salicola TaxID=3009082 RepID=A0ABT4W4B6_9RHOB|nr:polysaccharide biosynthesis C-terminal domain-containing protein [Aliiroseovarius sp. KMU-50]MDA5094652.1 polysaccharide biosynthesis C-terminal domain-containing protein [Aliiroseovarius sp. KMU-50]
MRKSEEEENAPPWFGKMNSRLIGVFIIRSLGIVALLGFEIALARSLGVAGYGSFSFLLAIAVVVSRLASLGWLNATTRLVSVFISTMSYELLKGSLVVAIVATWLGIAFAAVVLGVAVVSFELLTLHEAYMFILPLAAGLAFLELNRFVLRGLNAGDVGELYPFLLLPAISAIAIWALSIVEVGRAIHVYSTIVAALVLLSTISIVSRLPGSLWTSKPEFRTRQWVLTAFAMLVGAAGHELSVRMAVLVLGGLGNEIDAGLYQVAARLSLMTVFVLRVLTPVAAPKISVLFHAGKWEELRAIYWRLCGLAFVGALPFVLLFWLFPQWVLSWFGEGFEESAPILRILGLGYLASAAVGPCGTALLMIGREKFYSILTGSTVVLNGIGCYILAQYFGGIGAAIAAVVVIFINNGICFVVFLWATSEQRKTDFRTETTLGS